MRIIERHKREWNYQHFAMDRIEGDSFVIERSNLTQEGEYDFHRWIEKWTPVEKEVEIDGEKTRLKLLEHKMIYRDNFKTEEEVEYITVDVIPIIEKAVEYEKNGVKTEKWSLIKWLSEVKRVIA